MQLNVIKLSNIKKHFIVAQASCLCEIQAGCLYHHVKIHKGGTFSLNLMTLICNLNLTFYVVGFVVHCIGFIAQIIFANPLKSFNKGTRAPCPYVRRSTCGNCRDATPIRTRRDTVPVSPRAREKNIGIHISQWVQIYTPNPKNHSNNSPPPH